MIKNRILYKQLVYKILLLSLMIGSSSFIFSSNDDQVLIDAIKNNQINKAKELIKSIETNKIDLNAKNNKSETALIWACMNGHKEIVEMLLSLGADINIPDKSGNTNLMVACIDGNKEIAKMLINANSKPNIQSYSGWTALIVACFNSNIEIVRILIDAGVDTNIQSYSGWTAFNEAENYPEILSILSRAKENRLSNCHCKNLLCDLCKTKMQILPILKVNKSNLNDYIEKVEIIMNNSQITEKLAIRILDELIAFNDKKSIELKNRLRLLNYAECKECNELLCRECRINGN